MISYYQYLQFSPYFAQQDVEKTDDRIKFLKSFDALSQTIKDLLTSLETAEKIINTGKTFGLDDYDTEAVSFVIRKITAGEIFVGDGADFIANEAELPLERAKNLLSLIIREIFAPALEDIKKIQSTKLAQRTGRVSTSVQTQAKSNLAPARQPELSQNPNPNVIDLRNRQN